MTRDDDHAALLAGLIDVGGTAAPHPTGRCAALCTPACTATDVAAEPRELLAAPAG